MPPKMKENSSGIKKQSSNHIPLFFQFFLSIFFCYASFVSVYIAFFKKSNFDPLTIFFVITLVVFAFILVRRCFQSIKKISFQQFKQKRQFLIICFVSLLIGLFNICTQYSRGMHWAEIGQFSMADTIDSPIKNAYRQQQPPLDYYFSPFSNELWGENKFAVRFHAMVFYLFLCLILPVGLWYFCNSFWITSIGVLFFSVNHSIRLHSIDGRPLSLCLLTGLIFLFFYMSYYKRSNPKQDMLSTVASQYLFVISIGLQPVIFIASLFFSSFWNVFYKEGNKIFKELFISHLLTATLVTPFYVKMYYFAQDSAKYKPASFQNIISYVKEFDVFYFFGKFFFTSYEQLSPFFILLLILLFSVSIISQRVSRKILIIATSIIIFSMLLDFIFRTYIRWALNNWYFIVLSLFIILFVVLSLEVISSYLRDKRWKKIIIFPSIGLLLWNSYAQIYSIKEQTQYRFPYQSNDIEKVYDFLKKNGDRGDIAIQMALPHIPLYRPSDLNMYKPFFYRPNRHPFIVDSYITVTNTPPYFHEMSTDMIYYVPWQEITKKKGQKIFFISLNDNEEDVASSVLSIFMKEIKIGKFSIFQLSLKGDDKEKQYKRFLTDLIKKTDPKYSTSLYETLLFYACKNRDDRKFNRLLSDYKALELVLDEFVRTRNDNYPARFALKRRVKFFQEKTYCD